MASVAGELPDRVNAAGPKGIPWIPVAWFSALLIAAYFPILKHLVEQWSNDADVSHGFFVPIVAGFIAWQKRDQLLAAERKPAWWGVIFLIWGAAQESIGMLGAEMFLQRSAFLISLVGLLLVTCGTRIVKLLAFPLLLLPFMIPFPAVIYNQITFPLQLFASSVAETVLNMLNIPVLRDGNVLHLASQTLDVAEACSGIRSLMALSFLSLVFAYFFDTKVWMRWFLLIATVPIAILANAGRVTITGILSEKVNPDLAKGYSHEIEGLIIAFVGLLLIIALHGLVNRIYYAWEKRKVHSA